MYTNLHVCFRIYSTYYKGQFNVPIVCEHYIYALAIILLNLVIKHQHVHVHEGLIRDKILHLKKG